MPLPGQLPLTKNNQKGLERIHFNENELCLNCKNFQVLANTWLLKANRSSVKLGSMDSPPVTSSQPCVCTVCVCAHVHVCCLCVHMLASMHAGLWRPRHTLPCKNRSNYMRKPLCYAGPSRVPSVKIKLEPERAPAFACFVKGTEGAFEGEGLGEPSQAIHSQAVLLG